MPSSLPQAVLRSLLGTVPSGVVERGRRYFRDRLVFGFIPEGDIAFATVAGSYDYDVVVGLTEAARSENDCTCPYFEGHGVCKHLVAVLCQAYDQGALDLVGDDDFIQRLREHLGPVIDQTAQGVGTHQATARSRAQTGSRWRERLASFAAEQQAGGESLLPNGAELIYILDPSKTHRSDELTLEVAYRAPLSDGRWSVVKHQSWRRHDLHLLPTEADRYALSVLMGSPTANRHGYRRDYTVYEQNQSFVVPDSIQQAVFAAIGPTGRCYLRHAGKKDDLTALTWDGDEPWEPRIEVEPTKDNSGYRMSMTLRRGDQSMTIHEPAILTAGGIIVRDQTLSWFTTDRPETAAWIRSEHGSAQAQLRSRGGYGEIIIPRAEAGAMIEQLLSMPEVPKVSLPDELLFETMLGTPQPRLLVARPEEGHWEQRLTAQVSVGYGETWFDGEDVRSGVYNAQEKLFVARDEHKEAALTDQLQQTNLKVPNAYNRAHAWDFRLKPEDLPQTAAALIEAGWQVEADGKPYRNAGEIDFTVQTGIDWFELHGEVSFGEQVAPLPELLKALRGGSRAVLLDDGSHGLLPEDWLTRYGMLGEVGEVQGDHLRFHAPQAMLLDAMLAELPGVSVDAQFKQVRQRIKRAGKARPKAPPRTFKGELRPYQREGLGWMHQLGKLGLGGCLADDMGLGKTVQVLSMLDSRRTAKPADRPKHPSLVVVPKSLVFNWSQEAKRFTPNLRVLNHTGKERFAQHDLTKAELDTPQGAKAIDAAFHEADLVLTTYGTLRQDIAVLKDIHFDYAILDEAQAIKNHNTASAKAARLIRADHRLAVSGTPIENHLGELWSLFAFINPGILGQGRLGKQLQRGKHIDEPTRNTLSQALRPYILRRTKDQVATDLPEKTEQTLYCELPPKQRKHYNQLRDHYRDQLLGRIQSQGLAKSKIQVLEALLRLRQAACHPALINKQHAKSDSAKLDQLVPQLQAVLEEGHKALVFSQFTQFLGLLRKRLDPLHINYEYLDGKTRQRQDKVARFQDDPDCKLFLISLKAGGTGLNLTAADYVFLLDPWWNPAVEAQAIDRAHRIGQDKQVFAYRLIAKDTVEEKVIELQESKRELVDAIIGQDNSVLRDLTREDIESLLS